MEIFDVSVTKARITGLTKKPYYFKAKCFYAMSITFKDTDTLTVDNIPFIWLGEDKESAQKAYDRIVQTFEDAGIHEGDRVNVLFTDAGSVFAIGRIGYDTWIDAKDHFTMKSFSEMNYIFSGLTIY